MEHESKSDLWFPAKRYGWGWGFPIAWQGWIVLLAYVTVVLGATFRMLPWHPVSHLLLILVATAVLILICYVKGETPRWRWGDDDRDRRK